MSITATVISTLLGLLIKVYFENKKFQKKVHFLEEQSRINQLMRLCIAKTPIQRFLVLKITNSANELINGVYKRYLVSAINEEHSDIHISVMDFYQQIAVDDFYKEMVLKSYNRKFYKFVTKDESDCDLKRIYLKEKIEYSLIYFIHASDGVIYFCSLACYDNSQIMYEQEQIIDRTIAHIREIYRRYY